MSEGKSLVSARCEKLRRLGPLVEVAFKASMEHEGSAAYAALEAAYQQLEDQYETLAREIWASPVTSWQDIVERAELAYPYANDEPARSLNADDLGTRATAELVIAVLQMVGGEAWRRTGCEPSSEALP